MCLPQSKREHRRIKIRQYSMKGKLEFTIWQMNEGPSYVMVTVFSNQEHNSIVHMNLSIPLSS